MSLGKSLIDFHTILIIYSHIHIHNQSQYQNNVFINLWTDFYTNNLWITTQNKKIGCFLQSLGLPLTMVLTKTQWNPKSYVYLLQRNVLKIKRHNSSDLLTELTWKRNWTIEWGRTTKSWTDLKQTGLTWTDRDGNWFRSTDFGERDWFWNWLGRLNWLCFQWI